MWLRELKRAGQRTIHAVYFRIPDTELVLVGHYSRNHIAMRAAEAGGIMQTAESREGYEVIVSRKILSDEIHRVRRLSQVIGWRYIPGAHQLCTCVCIICSPPETINSRKKWQAWEARNTKSMLAREAKST
jgi:hypothetical protein